MADEADAWPAFHDEPLGDGRTWSAPFDSYDQYRDVVYYVVTVADGASFMVQVDLGWAATLKDWAGPEFTAGLRRRLAEVAATGAPNTTHTR
jgi:hypothetical protein